MKLCAQRLKPAAIFWISCKGWIALGKDLAGMSCSSPILRLNKPLSCVCGEKWSELPAVVKEKPA